MILTEEDITLRKPKKPGSIASRVLSIAMLEPTLQNDCDQIVGHYFSQKEKDYYYFNIEYYNQHRK